MTVQNSPPPKTREAAPRQGKAATQGANKSQANGSSQKPIGKRFDERQDHAEEIGKQLVAAIAEHGRAALHDLPLECFPTRPLADIAERTLGATDAGARGWSDVCAVGFTDAAEHVRNGFIECNEGFFPPSAAACSPLVESLRAFRDETRKREIAEAIRKSLENGDDIDAHLAALAKLKDESATVGIGDMLAERAFDFSTQPSRPVPIFKLAGMPLCTPGNITNIQAAPKVGKSAVVEAKLAAVMNDNRQGPDTLSFTAENPHGFALIHLDTEQSRFDADALVRRAIRRANLAEPPVWFESYSIADLGIYERRQTLRHVMDEATRKHGGIFAVMIDGIGDLCADPNDSEEAFDLVHELHTRAIIHDCAIVTVLHENPGSDKTRGHLGSQLERKAETNLRLAKDKDGVTTIWAERARHCYLPRESGPCFAWNDDAKMHLSCGTAGEMRQTANREKMQTEADKAFGGADSLGYTDLVTAIEDALTVCNRTAKNRVKAWLAEGIARKDSTGKHHLTNP